MPVPERELLLSIFRKKTKPEPAPPIVRAAHAVQQTTKGDNYARAAKRRR